MKDVMALSSPLAAREKIERLPTCTLAHKNAAAADILLRTRLNCADPPLLTLPPREKAELNILCLTFISLLFPAKKQRRKNPVFSFLRRGRGKL